MIRSHIVGNTINETKIIKNLKYTLNKTLSEHMLKLCSNFYQFIVDLGNLFGDKEGHQFMMDLYSLDSMNNLINDLRKIEKILIVLNEKQKGVFS
jgi:hypothetical protein